MLAIHPLRFTYIISGVIGLLGLDRLLALVLFRRAARAVTLTVTSNGDGSDSDLTDGVCNDGTGKCTLRAVIAQANSAAAINIPMGIHTLHPRYRTHHRTEPDPGGAGSGDTIIQAAAQPGVADFRVFNVLAGNAFAISGVTIRHGRVSGSGGIYNYGGLTLTDGTSVPYGPSKSVASFRSTVSSATASTLCSQSLGLQVLHQIHESIGLGHLQYLYRLDQVAPGPLQA